MPNHYFASDTSSCRTCILRFGTTQTSLFSLLMLLVLSTTVTKCILHLRAQPLIFICVHANTHLHPHLHLCVHILSSSMHLHVCARQHSPSSSSSLVCAHPLIFNASSSVCTPTLTFILIFMCVHIPSPSSSSSETFVPFQNVNRVSSYVAMGAYHAAVEVHGREWAYGMVEVSRTAVQIVSCPSSLL
jgi:hypothetical protein